MNLRLPSWTTVWKRPLQFGFAVACVVAVVSLFMPNYYRSEGCVLPVEIKGVAGGLGNIAAAAAAFGVNVPGGDGGDANFVDILKSRTLKERLLESEFAFKERSWRFGAEHSRLQTLEAYLKEDNRDRSLRSLGRILVVSRDLKSKVITLSAETRSPQLSQMIVRRSLELLEAFIQERGRNRGGVKASFAQERLAEARREMGKSEDEFRQFLDVNRNYLVSLDPGIRIKGMRLEAEFKLRQQLVTALSLSREQALLEEKNDMPILNILDPGGLPIEKSRPGRAAIVILFFLFTALVSGFWDNREWIRARIVENR